GSKGLSPGGRTAVGLAWKAENRSNTKTSKDERNGVESPLCKGRALSNLRFAGAARHDEFRAY
ncbi:MAG TPA: hypothetical protein VFH31_17175, partial [Pyrinomonadaceae bacterium]|nr:hypothetical protein [Pyrinomonadaceae bacterium]